MNPAARRRFPKDGDYEIPGWLTPLATWKNGYSAEETLRFRREYTLQNLLDADDVGAFATINTGDTFRTAQVRRKGPVADLEYNLMPEIANVIATTPIGTKTVQEAIADLRSRIRAFAVIHKGKIVYEQYPACRDFDSLLWASSSKTITGLLMALLEDEGLVDLKKPVGDYLPDFAMTKWGTIPLGDVVHQRSGLDIEEIQFQTPGHPMEAFYKVALEVEGDGTGRSLRDVLKTAEKKDDPGTQFIYSSMNTQISSLVVEAITGKPFHEVVIERIWHKMKGEGDMQMSISSSEEPLAFGFIASRLRDFARYGILFTPSWNVVANEPVLPKDYFTRVYESSKPEVYHGGYLAERIVTDFEETELGASYQWDAVFADGDVYKSGRSGQWLYISPSTDTVVVVFSATYRSEIWLHRYAREIVNSLFRN